MKLHIPPDPSLRGPDPGALHTCVAVPPQGRQQGARLRASEPEQRRYIVDRTTIISLASRAALAHNRAASLDTDESVLRSVAADDRLAAAIRTATGYALPDGGEATGYGASTVARLAWMDAARASWSTVTIPTPLVLLYAQIDSLGQPVQVPTTALAAPEFSSVEVLRATRLTPKTTEVETGVLVDAVVWYFREVVSSHGANPALVLGSGLPDHVVREAAARLGYSVRDYSQP